MQWSVAVGIGYLLGIYFGLGLIGMWCAFAIDENIRGVIFVKRWNSFKWAKKINSAIFPGLQGGPLVHVIAAKAVAFKEIIDPKWKDYAKQVKANAKVLGEVLVSRGYGKKTDSTSVRMTHEALQAIDALAAMDDIKRSEWIQDAAIEKLIKFKKQHEYLSRAFGNTANTVNTSSTNKESPSGATNGLSDSITLGANEQ